jgi:hypothetical protein
MATSARTLTLYFSAKYGNFSIYYGEGVSHMKETEIINLLRNQSEEFRKLEEEHRKLDQTLEEINKKKYLTTEEEIEKKKIQKQKLQYKDRMAAMIRQYKN